MTRRCRLTFFVWSKTKLAHRHRSAFTVQKNKCTLLGHQLPLLQMLEKPLWSLFWMIPGVLSSSVDGQMSNTQLWAFFSCFFAPWSRRDIKHAVYYLRFLWIDFHSLSDVSCSGQDPLVVAVCGTSETIKRDPGSAAGTRRMLVKAY